MPVWHYSVKTSEERSAKSVLWDAPVSPKKMVNLARILKGMKLVEAREFLERVAALKEPVPLFNHKRKQAHHRGVAERYGVPAARYPVKAAKILLKLLKNVENNAEVKGLDVDRLRITHIAVHKGRVLKRWMPRAFGRSTPRFKHLSHVEIVVTEEEQ